MKVLIGCPTTDRYQYCIDQYLNAVHSLDYSNCDLFLVDNSKDLAFYEKLKNRVEIEHIEYFEEAKERIAQSRNIIRERVLDGGYDFFLSLEQDILANKDTLSALLSHNKDIVSAYYGKRKKLLLTENGVVKPFIIDIPVVYLDAGFGRVRQANAEEVRGKGLLEIGAAGLGCMLISVEVLNKIRFRHALAFDDMLFCEDAVSLGYPIYLDSNHTVVHLHKPW